MLKSKLKMILIILISTIIVSGLSVYATYNYLARDVKYTKEDGTEISVEDALNELYELKNSNFRFLDRKVASKSETSSASKISVSKELEKGKYFIIISRSNRNDSAAGNTLDTSGRDISGGTFTGGDKSNCILYSAYGNGKDGKGYSNQRIMIYICELYENKTITYTLAASSDDANLVMLIYSL